MNTTSNKYLSDYANKVNYYVCLNTNGKISHPETIRLLREALSDLESNYLYRNT